MVGKMKRMRRIRGQSRDALQDSTSSKAARAGKSKVFLAGAAALTLASYGSTAASAAAPRSTKHAAVVNLTWETMWSGNTLTLLNQMTTAFNASHPGIHVTEEAIPSSTGDAKLLSQIAAGDPPNVFTEWNPVLGEYAADGTIQSMNPFLKGQYAGLEKWEYPIALQGGLYKGKLYAIPMSMNSWALYYNKSIMKAAGIASPPKTLAQLLADSKKEWKVSGNKLEQIGFYPNGGFENFSSFFNAVNCFNKAGKYDFANCKGAQVEAKFFASYANEPYALFNSLSTAYGAVAGGDDDPFVAGKQGFTMDGPWEGAQNIPVTNPAMEHNFGVEAFPGIRPGPSTFGQGNYNIIPKGAKNPSAAFTFITWLAGFNNVKFTSNEDPKGGWMPASPQIAAAPAYQKWIAANPWLKVYVQQMSSPYSSTPALTPTESAFETAETTATDDILEKTMSPAQALNYIDTQANAGASG